MLLLIDNFDSFTYNLVQAFQMLAIEVKVLPGHLFHLETCLALQPKYLVIGPGPGHPSQAFLSKKLINFFAFSIPILGVCLGHQLLAEYYGATVERAYLPIHGKAYPIFHTNKGVFQNTAQGFLAARYHSLIVNLETVNNPLEVSAWTFTKKEKGEKEIMGLRHKKLLLESLQFHPESILTECGTTLLKNFLTLSV